MKKFCNTSCCVFPPAVGLALSAVGEIADVGLPRWVLLVTGAPPAVDREGLVRLDGLRSVALALTLAPRLTPELAPPPMPASISVSARSTAGKLKLLLPSGPTIPAAAFSVGDLKAFLGSWFVFFEFSSKFLARNACSGVGLVIGGNGGAYTYDVTPWI